MLQENITGLLIQVSLLWHYSTFLAKKGCGSNEQVMPHMDKGWIKQEETERTDTIIHH